MDKNNFKYILISHRYQLVSGIVMISAGLLAGAAAERCPVFYPQPPAAAAIAVQSATPPEATPAQAVPYHATMAEATPAEPDKALRPDRLNLAYMMAEDGPGAESIAQQLNEELASREAGWTSEIYDLYNQSPKDLGARLGIRREELLGNYNPQDPAQNPQDPSTWVVPEFKGIHVTFLDGNGEAGAGRSNLKEIIAMASVYNYYGNAATTEELKEYVLDLWEASHRYSYQISPVYYCGGCQAADSAGAGAADSGAVGGAVDSDTAARAADNGTAARAADSGAAGGAVDSGTAGGAADSGAVGGAADSAGAGAANSGTVAGAVDSGTVARAADNGTAARAADSDTAARTADNGPAAGSADNATSAGLADGRQPETGNQLQGPGMDSDTDGVLAGTAAAPTPTETAPTSAGTTVPTAETAGIPAASGTDRESEAETSAPGETEKMIVEGVDGGPGVSAPLTEETGTLLEQAPLPVTCPGHVDLAVQIKIAGIDGNGNLFMRDSHGAASAGNGDSRWPGWNDETMGYVRTLCSQDWFEEYGLTVTDLVVRNPLTAEEIDLYMNMVPLNASKTRKDLVRFALNSVGRVPYYWGGKPARAGYEANQFGIMVSPDEDGRFLKGLDCSGWISWVYWSATGSRLPGESTSNQIQCGKAISKEELQPGDICIRLGTKAHTVMFLGWTDDGQMRCIQETSGNINNVEVGVCTADWPYYRRLVD